jgi:hypothetical protein
MMFGYLIALFTGSQKRNPEWSQIKDIGGTPLRVCLRIQGASKLGVSTFNALLSCIFQIISIILVLYIEI